MMPYNRIDSKVVSIHLGGCEIDYTILRQPGNQIICRFVHKIPEKAKTTREPLFHPEEEDFKIMIRRCARWNPDIDKFGSWDKSGCFVESTNPEETVCKCSEFGMLAVLAEKIEAHQVARDELWLQIFKYLGYVLSALALTFFIGVIAANRYDHLPKGALGPIPSDEDANGDRLFRWEHVRRLNRPVRDDRHTCTAFSVIIHYFYTAMGIWLALEC
ncbi:unnamed protein product, partial [Cyprideis torosa]